MMALALALSLAFWGSAWVPQIAEASAEALPDAIADPTATPYAGLPSALTLLLENKTARAFAAGDVSAADLELIVKAGVNAPSARNSQPWHFSVVSDAAVIREIAEGMSAGVPVMSGDLPVMDGALVPNETADAGEAGVEPPVNASAFLPPVSDAASDAAGSPPASGPDSAAVPDGFSPAMPSAVAKLSLADAPAIIVVSGASAQSTDSFDCGLACQSMAIAAQLLGYDTKIVSSPTIALNGERQAEYRQLLGIPDSMSAVAVLLIGCASEDDATTSATTHKPLTEVVTFVH